MPCPYLNVLKKDRKLYALVLRHSPMEKLQAQSSPHYVALCKSIIGQQVSIRVAEVLWHRFLALFPIAPPTTTAILALPVSTYRGIGLSHKKATYLLAVADFFSEHTRLETSLSRMDDEAILQTLTQIKGIGRWSVEMFLLFHLGREDVFSVGDLGIQKAMRTHYPLDENLAPQALRQQMLALAERWKPFRSYACLHLWESLKKQTF